jgi:hypothetical protein
MPFFVAAPQSAYGYAYSTTSALDNPSLLYYLPYCHSSFVSYEKFCEPASLRYSARVMTLTTQGTLFDFLNPANYNETNNTNNHHHH